MKNKDILKESSLITVGSAAAIKHEESGQLIHGTVIVHSDMCYDLVSLYICF